MAVPVLFGFVSFYSGLQLFSPGIGVDLQTVRLSISTGRFLRICNQNRADEVARNYRQNRGETINRASPLRLLQESRTKFVALISVTVETS